LPAGWAEHQDPGSGRTFYHNASTGETAWERPGGAAPTATASALPEGWAEHVDPGSGKTFYYHAASGQTSWEKPGGDSSTAYSADDSKLPDGWTEHDDPGSGRKYYYNASTGETAWEKPKASVGYSGSGIWSCEQARDIGNDKVEICRSLNIELLSTREAGSMSSVSRAVDGLNGGIIKNDAGAVALFSVSKDSYWLLWRSDCANLSTFQTSLGISVT
jgi:outer membrane protein assembly factor BamB